MLCWCKTGTICAQICNPLLGRIEQHLLTEAHRDEISACYADQLVTLISCVQSCEWNDCIGVRGRTLNVDRARILAW